MLGVSRDRGVRSCSRTIDSFLSIPDESLPLYRMVLKLACAFGGRGTLARCMLAGPVLADRGRVLECKSRRCVGEVGSEHPASSGLNDWRGQRGESYRMGWLRPWHCGFGGDDQRGEKHAPQSRTEKIVACGQCLRTNQVTYSLLQC